MRNHTRPLTIRIGLKGKFNWVLQSRGEVAALFQPTQPKPNPISDRSGQPDRCVERSGQPDDLHSMSVVKREMPRSLEVERKCFR